MRNIRLLIFDLEGTLLRPDDLILEAVYGAIEETNSKFGMNIPYPDEEEVLRLVGQPDFRVVQAIDPQIAAEAADYMRTVMNEQMRQLVEEGAASLYEGVSDALKALKAMDHQIAITCNYGRDYLIAILDYFNLYDYVDFSVCIEDVGHTDVRWMLEDILGNQQVLRSETVFIADRQSDIAAAHALDIRAVGCEWGLGTADELQDADGTVASPYDLIPLFGSQSRNAEAE